MKERNLYPILLLFFTSALAFGNLAQNPSMEGNFVYQDPLGEVAEYWTGWSGGYLQPYFFGYYNSYYAYYAHEGNKSQYVGWHSQEPGNIEFFGPDGIYQQINYLQPGQIYRVSVWFKYFFHIPPWPGWRTFGYSCITHSVGMDPNGGTNPDVVTNWSSLEVSINCEYFYDGPWLNLVAFFSPKVNTATLFIKLDGSGWGGAEEECPEPPCEGMPAPWDAVCYIDDVVVEPIQIGQGSTVEATSPVAADGVSYSDVTITVLDVNSNPIESIPSSEIIIECTGSGNIIIGPDEPTDANGLTTAKFFSTVSETKTVSVTVLGTVLFDTATVEFTPSWVMLTMQTNPNDVNTVTPPVGDHNCVLDTVVDISASRFVDCPDVYVFDYWDGDVADPCSAETTITMDTDKTVTAVFVDGRECGDECHPYPEGDVNKDCRVNFFDIAVVANTWLECTDPNCD